MNHPSCLTIVFPYGHYHRVRGPPKVYYPTQPGLSAQVVPKIGQDDDAPAKISFVFVFVGLRPFCKDFPLKP